MSRTDPRPTSTRSPNLLLLAALAFGALAATVVIVGGVIVVDWTRDAPAGAVTPESCVTALDHIEAAYGAALDAADHNRQALELVAAGEVEAATDSINESTTRLGDAGAAFDAYTPAATDCRAAPKP